LRGIGSGIRKTSIDAYFNAEEFEEELGTLPGIYSPPSGRLLLATADEEPAGCVALRPLDSLVP
jgi:hypothetical protein